MTPLTIDIELSPRPTDFLVNFLVSLSVQQHHPAVMIATDLVAMLAELYVCGLLMDHNFINFSSFLHKRMKVWIKQQVQRQKSEPCQLVGTL